MSAALPTRFDAVAFAGGGNRCYWQGGFWQALNAVVPQQPRFIVGVSAGAFQACFNLIGIGEKTRELAFQSRDDVPRDVDWRLMLQGQSAFVVGALYRQFLTMLFGEAELVALKRAPEILIQIAHPPRVLPGAIAAFPAIGAYQIEKLLTGAAHSRAGLYLGFKPAWISTHDIETPEALVEALMASASVPPFMPIGRINGRAALDGGLVDNPPLLKLAEVEAGGGQTLVLTTRSGRELPQQPGRVLVRPSEPVLVNKFTVRDGAGLKAAYELGLADGTAFAQRLVSGAKS